MLPFVFLLLIDFSYHAWLGNDPTKLINLALRGDESVNMSLGKAAEEEGEECTCFL
ncbi:hypothetical protein M758_12G086900 [Ceratodon purpureus]|uniref:Uncharacterized protein n=1 Tax=Ceratodon purpureus TaxID=3225 RepID=A0A8T0G8L0_CERPU|nr:hypothetical protein KC19_12G084900 [Ceratodon purpureus]KAG0598604.1 hypothetical protein M758_12G086900 [Ceratodon purpureus]